MSTIAKTINAEDVICGLKAAVTALECHHNMQQIKQKQEKPKNQEKFPGLMYLTDLLEDNPYSVKKSCKYFDVDESNVEICESKEVKAIFPEMRSGILYKKCYCVNRNGLQDTCPLIQCQGQSECLSKPWPVCPPGRLVQRCYPELYPN